MLQAGKKMAGVARRLRGTGKPVFLDLLQSLHVIDAGYLAHSGDDGLEMFEVGDIEDDVDIGATVLGAGLDVADIGLGVADHGGDLLEHAPLVIAQKGKLDGIGGDAVFLGRGPLHVDTAFCLIHQVCHVGAIHGVNRDTLAARDVADDRFAPDWITTAGPVHQEIAVTFHANGVGVSAENPANDAGEAVAIGLGSLTVSGGTGWGETTENLASGVLAITDAGHKVVRTAETIVGSDLLIVLLFEVLERKDRKSVV